MLTQFSLNILDLAEYVCLRGLHAYADLLLECAIADSVLPFETTEMLEAPAWLLRCIHSLAHGVEYIFETAHTWYLSVRERYLTFSV